jgi:hypothetical protein
MSISNVAEVVLVDATLASNAILLPPANSIPYRVLTFKDLYGRSQLSTIVINTQGSDTFEDGVTTSAQINLNYGATTFYAGLSNRWMTLGGTVLSNAQIQSLSSQSIWVSSINGALPGSGSLTSIPSTLSTFTLFTSSLTASTITTLAISTLDLWVSSVNGQAFDQLFQSTVAGLGSADYISSSQLISTAQGLETYISSFIDPQELASSVLQFISATYFTTSLTSTVEGLGSAGYISSFQLVSTVAGLGQIYSSTMGGGLASIPSTLSTTQFFTSSILASTIQTIVISSQQLFTSSLVANSLNVSTALLSTMSTGSINFATGFGYLTMPDIYPNTVYTSTVVASNLLVGWNPTLSPIQFFGFGTYSNTVIAEVSTGATTQELLFFRASNASDRIRMQTTGSIVFEPGVSARIWPTAPSNVTPAMILNTSSNIGIQLAAPTVPLDVGGAIRGITFSTQQIATSSIINNPTVQGAFFNSSLRVGVFSTFFGGAMSTSFMTAGMNEIDFFTSNVLRMTLLGNGNIGIGTGAPGALFDVAGTGRFTTVSTVQLQMSSATGTAFLGTAFLGSNSIISSMNTNTFSSGTTAASSFTGRWNDAQFYVLQTI